MAKLSALKRKTPARIGSRWLNGGRFPWAASRDAVATVPAGSELRFHLLAALGQVQVARFGSIALTDRWRRRNPLCFPASVATAVLVQLLAPPCHIGIPRTQRKGANWASKEELPTLRSGSPSPTAGIPSTSIQPGQLGLHLINARA